MIPEEAYEETPLRIREAEKTGAIELDLSGLELDRLPPELARLTSLQSLYFISPGASGSAIFPRWSASPRSSRFTWITVLVFAGLPRSNPCYLR